MAWSLVSCAPLLKCTVTPTLASCPLCVLSPLPAPRVSCVDHAVTSSLEQSLWPLGLKLVTVSTDMPGCFTSRLFPLLCSDKWNLAQSLCTGPLSVPSLEGASHIHPGGYELGVPHCWGERKVAAAPQKCPGPCRPGSARSFQECVCLTERGCHYSWRHSAEGRTGGQSDEFQVSTSRHLGRLVTIKREASPLCLPDTLGRGWGEEGCTVEFSVNSHLCLKQESTVYTQMCLHSL